MDCTITNLEEKHFDEVIEIFKQGINTGNARFEGDIPTFAQWQKSHLSVAQLVAVNKEGIVAGWIALSPTSSRDVFRGVAEVSIYIHEDFRGCKIGDQLLSACIAESESKGIWTLESLIFTENTPSIALHKKHGFRLVGTRERIGQMDDGRWRDVALLERRSDLI